jgi:hypothetical protein
MMSVSNEPASGDAGKRECVHQTPAMEVCANNGSEMMMSMLSKGDVQKRLQTERDKVLLMTDALKRGMEGLRSELGEARVRNQSLNALPSTLVHRSM